MAGVFGEALSPADYARYLRVAIARDTGWTLAQVDGLSLPDLLDYLAVRGALSDIEGFLLRR